MKQKPIKTCTGLNCPERICSECQKGHYRASSSVEGVYFCSNCGNEWKGNPCTAGIKYTTDEEEAEYDKLAGEKNWKELDEITETINNTKYIEAKLVKELLKSEKEKWQKEQSGWNELKQLMIILEKLK